MRLIDMLLLSMVSSVTPLMAVTSTDIGELPDENQIPRLVTMNYYRDTKSQMAFNWNTTYPTNSDLQVVKKSIGVFNSEYVLEYQGEVKNSQVNDDGFIHRVVATGLEAGESYLYRVGDKQLDNWSSIGEFKTVGPNSKVKFLHISDPQVIVESDGEAYGELLSSAISTNEPEFICLTGDIVNNSWKNTDPNLNQWEWSITNQNEYLKNLPVMTVAGNHEASAYDYISRYNLPIDDDVDTIHGAYYSFDYNDIHFTCLNTNDSTSEINNLRGLSDSQIKWLKKDLEASKKSKWKIVMLHKGLYDAGGHCSDVDGEDGDIALIREQLSPIFTKYGIDVVLQGHDHLYSRSYPIKGKIIDGELMSIPDNQSKDTITFEGIEYGMYKNADGPIYLNSGSGSGSKYYNVVDYNKDIIPLETAYGATNPMYTSFTIENNRLYANVYEVIDGQSVLYDTFGIIKLKQTVNANLIAVIIVSASVIIGIATVSIVIIKKKGIKKNG